MMPKLKLIFFFLFSFISLESLHAQKTKVYGAVTDEETGEGLPFVRVYFYDSKIGTTSDSTGKYVLESYYATDSIVFTFLGYKNKVVKIKKDVSQELNCQLSFEVVETEEVVIRPPDDQQNCIKN